MTKKLIECLSTKGIGASETISEIIENATSIKKDDAPTVLTGKLRFPEFEENLIDAISIALIYCSEEFLSSVIEDFSVKDLHNFIYDTRNFLSEIL